MTKNSPARGTAPRPDADRMHRMPAETLEARIAVLADRHAALDAELQHEMARLLPDETRIRRLKLGKLRLKDDISFLSGLTRTLSRTRAAPMAPAG